MRRERAFSCLSALVLVFGIAPAPIAAPETNRIRRVETGLLSAVVLKGHSAPMRLADRMAYYNVPGVSIAVINNGEIEWTKGYGSMEAGDRRPVTARTRFQAASISKPVTAMAALALVQQGTLSLDEERDCLAGPLAWPDHDRDEGELRPDVTRRYQCVSDPSGRL